MSAPIVDFDEVIQWNLSLNSILRETDFRIIAVSEDEINTLSFDTINEFIERLSANGELLIKSANSLDIFFPEYDKDTREIFQIPEIMRWLKHSIDKGVPWFYFLSTKNKNNGLHLLIHSYCSKNIFL
uniref:chlororespiratory reduction 6 domain-containing protein n=1 Tax=Siminovitchia sp. FSL W7-1587 TaxID=2954699 RepID=UPI00403E93FB